MFILPLVTMITLTANKIHSSLHFFSHSAFYPFYNPFDSYLSEEMLRSLILLVAIFVIFHFEPLHGFNSAFFLFIIFNPLYPFCKIVKGCSIHNNVNKIISISHVTCASIISFAFLLKHYYLHVFHLKYTIDFFSK